MYPSFIFYYLPILEIQKFYVFHISMQLYKDIYIINLAPAKSKLFCYIFHILILNQFKKLSYKMKLWLLNYTRRLGIMPYIMY